MAFSHGPQVAHDVALVCRETTETSEIDLGEGSMEVIVRAQTLASATFANPGQSRGWQPESPQAAFWFG